MKHDKAISQNTMNKPYVRPVLFFGGFMGGALITAIFLSSKIQDNRFEKANIVNDRNWSIKLNNLDAERRSLKEERDMLQAKCARFAEEKAKLEQKASTNQKQKKR